MELSSFDCVSSAKAGMGLTDVISLSGIDTTSFCNVPLSTTSFSTVPLLTTSFYTVPLSTTSFCTVPLPTTSFYTIPLSTTSFCTVPLSTTSFFFVADINMQYSWWFTYCMSFVRLLIS